MAEPAIPLIDSHAHLQAEAFAADRGEVLAAARRAGLVRVLVAGWDLASSLASVELAGQLDVDASAGIHPHVARQADAATWGRIVELAAHPAVVAVGETGLDYDRSFAPRDAQLANLRRHLELGRNLGKPVILHCRSRPGMRDAQDDLLHELAAAGAGSSRWSVGARAIPALLHSFSGPVDYAEAALSMGLAISFSGLVFRRGEESSAEVARLVPGNRLLVETDAPYLSPPGGPHRRNEPKYVAITLSWLAAQQTEDEAGLAERLVANYDSFFGRAAATPTARTPGTPATPT
ncbi:MAG TPA: TatD family hydrolase [Candidatus Caenarcaniphilales bacterium]|nr:TatD family hydrolase [Candidatus Caenarcaniphilales bacterium]